MLAADVCYSFPIPLIRPRMHFSLILLVLGKLVCSSFRAGSALNHSFFPGPVCSLSHSSSGRISSLECFSFGWRSSPAFGRLFLQRFDSSCGVEEIFLMVWLTVCPTSSFFCLFFFPSELSLSSCNFRFTCTLPPYTIPLSNPLTRIFRALDDLFSWSLAA